MYVFSVLIILTLLIAFKGSFLEVITHPYIYLLIQGVTPYFTITVGNYLYHYGR